MSDEVIGGPRRLTKQMQQDLLAPFDPEEIEFMPRAATGDRALALPHIDARNVMERLDRVVGPDGWNFTFESLNPQGTQVKGRLEVLGMVREDAGESSTEDEKLKSAVSDAVKRCAVHFGIGRYLYRLPQIWANYDSQRRRFTEKPQVNEGALLSAARKAGWTGGPQATPVQQNRQVTHQPSRRQEGGQGAPNPPMSRPPQPGSAPQPESRGDDASTQPAQPATEPAAASSEATGMACAGEGCGKTLTKGQNDVSMRAFGRPLCPSCQRNAARAA